MTFLPENKTKARSSKTYRTILFKTLGIKQWKTVLPETKKWMGLTLWFSKLTALGEISGLWVQAEETQVEAEPESWSWGSGANQGSEISQNRYQAEEDCTEENSGDTQCLSRIFSRPVISACQWSNDSRLGKWLPKNIKNSDWCSHRAESSDCSHQADWIHRHWVEVSGGFSTVIRNT